MPTTTRYLGGRHHTDRGAASTLLLSKMPSVALGYGIAGGQEEELVNLADLLETPRRVAAHTHFTNRVLSKKLRTLLDAVV